MEKYEKIILELSPNIHPSDNIALLYQAIYTANTYVINTCHAE